MPQRTSASMYLADRLREIAVQNVAAAQAQADEERQIRVQTKISEIQFEQQKKIHQLALEETKRIEQEKLGKEIVGNVSMGFNLQKHAHLISDDPQERERLKGIGKWMQDTGKSAEELTGVMKTLGTKETGAERIARRKEEILLADTEKYSKFTTAIADYTPEQLSDKKIQAGLMKHLAGVTDTGKIKEAREYIKYLSSQPKTQLPPEVKLMFDEHKALSNQMQSELFKAEKEELDLEEVKNRYAPLLNQRADVVNAYLAEQGEEPILETWSPEKETTPKWGFGFFGGKEITKIKPKKPVGKQPETKETPKSKPKKDISIRTQEIITDNPKLTDDEITEKLREEGY